MLSVFYEYDTHIFFLNISDKKKIEFNGRGLRKKNSPISCVRAVVIRTNRVCIITKQHNIIIIIVTHANILLLYSTTYNTKYICIMNII